MIMLRTTFVNELLGSNESLYTDFIPCDDNGDFATEAKRFLEQEYFNTSLGDLMPLAIATALKVTIFIMPSNLQTPPLYVIPLCGEPVSMMFLVHNLVAGRHYDAAILYSCTITKTSYKILLEKIHMFLAVVV